MILYISLYVRNIWNSRSRKPTVAKETACALIRHAFNCHYYELVMVATNPQKQYSCERVYARTMRNYRDAVLAFTVSLIAFFFRFTAFHFHTFLLFARRR
jgi:hypothetical protein